MSTLFFTFFEIIFLPIHKLNRVMNVRKLIGFAAVCMIIMFGFFAIRALPVETEDYIAKKYEGYSGVIKCWICADFSCAGSFNSWLNSCAAPFERAHDGVYIEIETVSASAMEARDQAIAPPDMIFYSPSMKNTEHLTGACVLALGGTIGVTRDGAQFDPAQCAIGRDSNRDMAAAAILAGAGDSKSAPVEEIGVDLGLPAGTGAAMTAEQALQTFIDGSASCAMVTSAQLSKLIDRRDRGLSPNWECVRADTPFTDQLLLGAANCGGDKQAVCLAFLKYLTGEESQMRLADIVAHSPTMRIYPDTSPYAAMDAAIARPDRISPRMDANTQIDCLDMIYLLRSGDLNLAAAQKMVAERYNAD